MRDTAFLVGGVALLVAFIAFSAGYSSGAQHTADRIETDCAWMNSFRITDRWFGCEAQR